MTKFLSPLGEFGAEIHFCEEYCASCKNWDNRTDSLIISWDLQQNMSAPSVANSTQLM